MVNAEGNISAQKFAKKFKPNSDVWFVAALCNYVKLKGKSLNL